jgi:phosphohistidine phosphatase
MHLVLVRHAEAANGTPDELRPLTANGREQARSLGERLQAEGVRPDAIVTSPLVRARETAELLGGELGVRPVPDERAAPGATPEGIAEAVAGKGETVVVVGHQPDCSRIAAALTGDAAPDFAPADALSLRLYP